MDFKRIGDYFVKDEVARNKIAEETEARKTAISQIFDSINTSVTNRLNEFGNSVTTAIENLTNYVNETVTNLTNSVNTSISAMVNKDKFYVITGEYQNATPEEYEYIEVEYPEGFTCDNCTIISTSQRKGSDDGWIGIQAGIDGEKHLDSGWYLGASNIRFRLAGHLTTLALDIEYRIVLMKLD